MEFFMEPRKHSALLSIVIPVYNEEDAIDAALDRLLSVHFPEDIVPEWIAVDDGSTDRTGEHLRRWRSKGVKTVHHEVNRGKGAALRSGFEQAGGDFITIQDADMEYDPLDLPALVRPLIEDKADFVCGVRTPLLPGEDKTPMGMLHRFINRFLTSFCNLFLKVRLHDMECCYKVFRRDFLKKFELKENRFGFEPEITLKMNRADARFAEGKVSYTPRSFAEGKKINWKDGVSALRCILHYGLFPEKMEQRKGKKR